MMDFLIVVILTVFVWGVGEFFDSTLGVVFGEIREFVYIFYDF